MERILEASPQRRDECPTCGSVPEEIIPGVRERKPSSYFFEGEDIPCDCTRQIDLFRHYLLAHIPEEYMRLEVGTKDDRRDYFGDEQALEETFKYLSKWDSYKYYGLGLGYYSTKQGTGKTFLATLVAREAVKKGESVLFVSFRDVASLYEIPYEIRIEKEERIKNCTLLVLDEVAESSTAAQRAFFADKFEELIRCRTNYNRVTILTTNLKSKELEKEYPRIYSLLSAKEQHIEVKGGDRRQEIYDISRELIEHGERRPLS